MASSNHSINTPVISLRRRIPSARPQAQTFINSLLRAAQRCDWDEDARFGLHLAVEEAVANAIKHGNVGNEDKFIDLEYRVSRDGIVVRVADQGNGFCPASVPDPTEDAHVARPSGRGLFLMRRFMSQVRHNAAGNEVCLTLRRSNGATVS